MLVAVMVRLIKAPVPAAGMPLSTPVVGSRVRPMGRDGLPVIV